MKCFVKSNIQSFLKYQGRFTKFAMIALLSMIPRLAYGCIMSDNPCDVCDPHFAIACGFEYNRRFLLTDVILVLTGTTGKALCTIFQLAGFYWAIRNKAAGWKKTLLLVIGQEILLIVAILLLALLSSVSLILIVLWPFEIWFLLWLWRKEIIWWKALFPMIFMTLIGGASLAFSLGYIY